MARRKSSSKKTGRRSTTASRRQARYQVLRLAKQVPEGNPFRSQINELISDLYSYLALRDTVRLLHKEQRHLDRKVQRINHLLAQ